MANTYGVFNNGTVVLEYWQGTIKLDELVEHETKQLKDSLIRNSVTAVVDCRDANFDMTLGEVEQFIQVFTSDNNKLKHMAIVINKQSWKIANEYCHKAWKGGFEILTFFDLESACIWLKFDDKNTHNRLKALKDSLSLGVL